MARQRSSTVRRFKGETVYDWESEPADERPTGFDASTSFAASTLSTSGFHSTSTYNSTLEARRRAARYKRRGSVSVWLMLGFVLAAATAGVTVLGRFLKG
jgi:hypothetical protein